MLFSQNESESGRVVWEYVGGYEFKVVGELRGSTFKGLPEDVKRAWGKLLASTMSRKRDVYVSLRARVALRKFGIAVDPEAEQLEMAEIRAGRGYALDGQDIVKALSSGEEGIKVLGMRCTSYDHAFVEELIAKRRNWTPKPRKEKKEKKLELSANSTHSNSTTNMHPKAEDTVDPGPLSSRERRRRRRLDLSSIDFYAGYEENIDDDPSYEAGESSGGED
ncbi:hypothetical protein BDZ89DRAFT_208416 [Hymenopellis radicata]|nr:hypothetical protein BDZ89DRAFT_208416 [Hymenopellis radicata]